LNGHFLDRKPVYLQKFDDPALPTGKSPNCIDGRSGRFMILSRSTNHHAVFDVDFGFDELDATLSAVMVGYSVATDRINPRPDRSSRQKCVKEAVYRKQRILQHVFDHLSFHSLSQKFAQYTRGLDQKPLIGGVVSLLSKGQEARKCFVSFGIQFFGLRVISSVNAAQHPIRLQK
jgi:hypothetical protein